MSTTLELAQRLCALLSDPEPGLSTWQEAVTRAKRSLRDRLIEELAEEAAREGWDDMEGTD